MARWELARALVRMREQVDERAPRRNRRSDGTVGDNRHASRTSDHNPRRFGVQSIVLAIDFTHSPKDRIDTWALAEGLREVRDPRVSYVISNSRIFSSINMPWKWRRYTGSNKHISHIHISARSERRYWDDVSDWDLRWGERDKSGNEEDLDRVELRPILRRGSRGEEVETVQRLLMLSLIDGVYGELTEQAVRAFQRKEKLAVVDGVVGVETWRILDTIEQLPLPLNYDEPRLLSEP